MLARKRGVIGAIIGGLAGIALALFGFWRTLLVLILAVLGFLIGGYWESRRDSRDDGPASPKE